MPNCAARWGPMGPMGPDCAVPPAKCVIIHVAPLIIMCVQTAFGNSHTHAHTYTHTQTHLLARSLILWTISSILLWRQFHQVSTPDGVNKRPWGLVAREISVYTYVSLWCFTAEDLTTLKVDWGSQRSCRSKKRMSLWDIGKSRECRPVQSQSVHLLCSALSICRLVWHEECGRASLFIEPT